MAGIKEGRKFRYAFLKQRDLVVGCAKDRQTSSSVSPVAATASVDSRVELLVSIGDTLLRIETTLDHLRPQ